MTITKQNKLLKKAILMKNSENQSDCENKLNKNEKNRFAKAEINKNVNTAAT